MIAALEVWGAEAASRRDDLIGLGYFGSYARGDAAFGSDLDLVMIVEEDRRPFTERGRDWRTETLPVPVDLLIYTVAEWERLQAAGGRFARTLSTEARWLRAPGRRISALGASRSG